MRTQCNAEQLGFSCTERRRLVAAFDGGTISSNAGSLQLGKAARVIGLIERLSRCFVRERNPALVEHSVRSMHTSSLLIYAKDPINRQRFAGGLVLDLHALGTVGSG